MKGALERHRFDVTFTCKTCRHQLIGWLALDERFMVCDSGNFVLFNDGPKCDSCVAIDDPILADPRPISVSWKEPSLWEVR